MLAELQRKHVIADRVSKLAGEFAVPSEREEVMAIAYCFVFLFA